MKGAVAAREHQYQYGLFLAWHIASLQRVKRIPKLKTLLNKVKRTERKPMTWQEMLSVAKMITAALNMKRDKNG